MADTDRNVLDFYQLSDPFPQAWPEEKNNKSDDDSEDDLESQRRTKKQQNIQRRKSRYQALERTVSTRSSVFQGSEKSAGGVSTLVQRDEPDPLGTTNSVIGTLKQLNVPVQDDVRLRNRFLLSSTSFSPALFLSQMHATADTTSLLNGLDTLSKSIDKKSASLKVLVESNFERFVKAKATIDNVYNEMKYRGAEPPSEGRPSHARHASRGSFRSGSTGAPLASPLTPIHNDSRKKNALIKESDYGVMGIKTPLLDVSAKAEDVWGPALGGREKEENLRTVLTLMSRHKETIECSSLISESIKRKDYEALVEEYGRARKHADEARKLVKDLGSVPPSESQTYQILVVARMWYDVQEQIQNFKRDVWKRLTTRPSKTDTAVGQPQDQSMELISLLLELGVDDNPIWVWLLSRYDSLKGKVSATAERTKIEVEVLRRRLANGEKPTPHMVASHLRALSRQSADMKAGDSPDVLELWEKMLTFLSTMLSNQGILGEILEFWQTVEGFIEERTQKTLPVGFNGESRKHHQIPPQNIAGMRRGIIELVDMLRAHIFDFFAGAPPEDISLLFSPYPVSPSSPMTSASPLSPSSLDPRFNFDSNNLPPPSPRRGESWEKFAFWPPGSNSISGVHYLAKMLTLVGSGAADMANLAPVAIGDPKQVEMLKNLVGASRERCVTALCAAWNKDAENIKFVEDWKRPKDMGDVTRMPASFAAFEGALLSGMQKILYVSEAMSKPGAENIVLPPPAKLLQMVRSQYVTTLYKALSGMVENAERAVKKAEDEWTIYSEGPSSSANGASIDSGAAAVDAGDRNVRMLLTLSNLASLRSQVVPNLNGQFENAFSVKLTDESKTIRDVLGQIDARLFQTYTRPSIESIRKIIRAGLSDPNWASSPRPTEVKPYIYEVLVTLVLVHTQVSTTAPSLTSQVLSYLLEQTSRELHEALQQQRRQQFDIAALTQATLDVEFVAQTLSQYTTERASQLQGEIYATLDARTDSSARAHLQEELPQMREVLKKLRDQSKSEFACFKKQRTPTGGGVVGVSGGGGGGGGVSRTGTPASAAGLERQGTG